MAGETPCLAYKLRLAVDAAPMQSLSQKAVRISQRSKVETGMYRYKQMISLQLSLRNHNAQVGEMFAGVKILNKVIGLGMPVRQTLN